ncbi:restriction endonuclease subunit S [Cyanobium sp. FGCU-52]|nr:restriction endonuclease subunit S [Cyanobium sp. FGCU52]
MNEQLEKLFDWVAAGEWGSDQGTAGGIDTGVIRSANFTKDHKFNSKEIVVRSIEERKRQKKLLYRGDILIEKSGGSPDQPVGRVLFYDLEVEHTCSNFISILRPSRQADPKFLYYSLCNLYDRGVVKNYQQQTTGIINLQLGEYLRESIFLPPLPEQKKIAEILSGIDKAVGTYEQQHKVLTGILYALMQEEIAQSKFALRQKIGDLCTSQAGGTPDRSQRTNYQGNIPWVKSGEVRGEDIIQTDEKISEEALLNSSAKIVPSGSVLVAMYGATAGQTARLRIDATTNQAVLALNTKTGELSNNYLYYAVTAFKEQLLLTCQGSGQPNLSSGLIRELEIPLPSPSNQERIATTLDSVSGKISTLGKKINATRVLKSAVANELLSGRKRVSV